eukprot:6197737-Pleurochrysis_carterae.AAC.1
MSSAAHSSVSDVASSSTSEARCSSCSDAAASPRKRAPGSSQRASESSDALLPSIALEALPCTTADCDARSMSPSAVGDAAC